MYYGFENVNNTKGCKKKMFTTTKMAISQSIFNLNRCYAVSGILSGFQIILLNFCETWSFDLWWKNVPKGWFFKMPGKILHMSLVSLS